MKSIDRSGENAHLWLSGGAEGVVKIWDTRVSTNAAGGGCLHIFGAGGSGNGTGTDCVAPIETVRFFQGSTMFASCGGKDVKIWDLKKGGGILL